jgi:hypothetical protein
VVEGKVRRLLLAVGAGLLLTVILALALYVRLDGSNVFVATSVGAIPTAVVVIAMTYLLRKASLRAQLAWGCFSMILMRSVQVWLAGIDFRDELRFIEYSQALFQEGRFLGYLRYYPVNVPFATVFYGLFTVWGDVEVFEVLAFLVYPLLVVGYWYMSRQLLAIRPYGPAGHSSIPAVLLLPFAPTFTLIPTYYWPQLLGLVVLFFAVGSVLRFVACSLEESRRCFMLTVGLSIMLVFTHSVSSALFALTVPFFYWACADRRKRRALVFIEFFVIFLFVVVHNQQYGPVWYQLLLAVLGDAAAWQRIERYSFPDVSSISRQGFFMTLAHTGFFLVMGILVMYRLAQSLDSMLVQSPRGQRRWVSLVTWPFTVVRTDPVAAAFVVLGVVALASAAFFGGNFLDPVRIIGWISLLALPVVLPKRRAGALAVVVVLLFLFFLLVWTVNSPWGSPIGSSVNLNDGGLVT